ncbi:VanZ family protein [Oxalobacter sp. OttesenSCG-928-P03]|nr:VanZ family protein [Oxalobacter sp. OttesenSCG-928-P03]
MTERLSQTFHRPSSFLRAALLVYVFLIAYASLYPFSGWRGSGVFPLTYLYAPLPRYWTWFDVLINVTGYIPLGVLLATAVSPLLRGARAFFFAFFTGTLLSLVMEALQVYLPSRVPSNLDLMTNATGVFAGAFLGTILAPVIFREDRIHYFIQRWLRFGSSRVLIIPMLWPLAQIYPQNYLFGHGEVLPALSGWLSAFLARPVNLSQMITGSLQLTAEQYWLSETIITATGLTGAILVLLWVLQKNAPRIQLALLMLLIALLFKIMACALFFQPENALVWLTPGAIGGLIVGVLMLSGLIFTPPLVQRRIAIVMLFISLVTVNVLPDNQYFLSTLQTWSQGKFLNFNGAAHFLTMVWPFFALWFLFRSIYKLRYSE